MQTTSVDLSKASELAIRLGEALITHQGINPSGLCALLMTYFTLSVFGGRPRTEDEIRAALPGFVSAASGVLAHLVEEALGEGHLAPTTTTIH